jgi:hypothetical protein
LLFFAACTTDDDNQPAEAFQVPQTYEFDNVDYSGQTARLAMLLEMKSYMATSQTQGVALDANKLAAMFANDGAAAGFNQNYDPTKQLRGKTFEPVQADFDALIVELAEASQSTVPGSEGVSGVIENFDGQKSYLVGEDGLDHAQLIEKGLMGACIYYQAATVYMGDGKMDVDNETVTPGKGTAMEHHWDEAFGYLGAPIDFPINTDGLFFWADYANKREAVLGNSQALMDALIKGRAAISADRLDLRDEAIVEARREWELVSVATALHYLNVGVEQFDDMAIRSHALSEAIGFVYTLQFNEGKRISNSEVQEILELIAGSSDFSKMNLYQTAVADLETAKEKLADWYDLSEQMEDF